MAEQIKIYDYVDVPCGYYMCFINGVDRIETKSGKPAVKVTLKINKACDEANADFEGRYMWVYQVTTTTIGQKIADEWENIYMHFPTTPIKVSKFEREGKNGTVFTNYKPWLNSKQAEQLNA